MNQNKEVPHTRRSIGHFLPELIPDDILRRIVENGIWAPSARDKQIPVVLRISEVAVQSRLLLGYLAENPVPRPREPVEEVAICE